MNKNATMEDVVCPMWSLLGKSSHDNGYEVNNRKTVGSVIFSAVCAEAVKRGQMGKS
jgi:hypothetical protein